jgi:hypothetical protein
LSFEYKLENGNDKVWFAYAIPYTYTMLCNFIKVIEERQEKEEGIIFKKEIIGKSLSGVEIPVVTITDFKIEE